MRKNLKTTSNDCTLKGVISSLNDHKPNQSEKTLIFLGELIERNKDRKERLERQRQFRNKLILRRTRLNRKEGS